MTKDDIEADAKRSAQADEGDKQDCKFREGSAGYKIWMATYTAECEKIGGDLDLSYRMSFR